MFCTSWSGTLRSSPTPTLPSSHRFSQFSDHWSGQSFVRLSIWLCSVGWGTGLVNHLLAGHRARLTGGNGSGDWEIGHGGEKFKIRIISFHYVPAAVNLSNSNKSKINMISFHSPSAVLVHSGVRALQRERRSSRLRSRTLVQLWGTLALTVTETNCAVQVGKLLTMCSIGGENVWYILSWAVKVSTANLVTIDLTLLGLLSLILLQWQSMTIR